MKSELKTIKKASFIKRILATIMDGAVAIFTFFALFLFVFSPIARNAFGYKDLVQQGSDLQIASHLYVLLDEKDTNNTPIYLIDKEESEISFYMERLEYYYTQYKTSEAPDYNVEITDENGNKVLPINYYTKEWFSEKMKDVTTVEKAKDASLDAVKDFYKYVSEISMKIKRCEAFILIPSFILSYSGFFILVPLLYKNGETFGKKVMGIGLATKDGYSVRKRQIVLRQLFLFFLTVFASLIIGIGFTSFATLFVGVFIYYLATFISRTNRSFADYLAYTYMIDTKNSVWFNSEIEEKDKENEIEKNLEKLNKIKEKDSHILQVGSTIVNEEAKQEVLAEQVKNNQTKKNR